MTDIWYPNMYDVLISSYAVMMTIAGIILCFLKSYILCRYIAFDTKINFILFS